MILSAIRHLLFFVLVISCSDAKFNAETAEGGKSDQNNDEDLAETPAAIVGSMYLIKCKTDNYAFVQGRMDLKCDVRDSSDDKPVILADTLEEPDYTNVVSETYGLKQIDFRKINAQQYALTLENPSTETDPDEVLANSRFDFRARYKGSGNEIFSYNASILTMLGRTLSPKLTLNEFKLSNKEVKSDSISMLKELVDRNKDGKWNALKLRTLNLSSNDFTSDNRAHIFHNKWRLRVPVNGEYSFKINTTKNHTFQTKFSALEGSSIEDEAEQIIESKKASSYEETYSVISENGEIIVELYLLSEQNDRQFSIEIKAPNDEDYRFLSASDLKAY